MKILTTSVLIVGAGPVGLTLGIDLASRGVSVMIAELRRPAEPPTVRCNHVSARSMEIFRRLGLAAKVRNAGLPEDFPNDCVARTTTLGFELMRIPIPGRRDRYTATGGPDTWWPTPEPPHRINQIFLEPVMFAHAQAMPGLCIFNRTSVDSFVQDKDGVVAELTDLDTGDRFRIEAEYLIGCDGGRSGVRRAIGAQMQGTPVVQRVQSTYIRAPQLLGMLPHKPAWVTISLNPRRSGNVMAIDGRETWLIHNYLREDEADFDAIDRDWSIRTILGVGPDFTYEILANEDWIGRRLVADRFRDRRVFLAGDAAHIWVPYAGYGMNAGIADAANLAWLLAARIKGWGHAGVLDAYEHERMPITEQVSFFAMNYAHRMIAQRRAVPVEIEDDTLEGAAARDAVGKAAYELNVQQYCCGGLNFGYFYDRSPLIAYDGEPHPSYTMAGFTPSTVPGCRTPHLFLRDGRSLYDALGAGYTLIRSDPTIDAAPLLDAAARRGVPLALLDLDADDPDGLYRHKLVLSRPDQHVAWRGDAMPADPDALVATISGAAAG